MEGDITNLEPERAAHSKPKPKPRQKPKCPVCRDLDREKVLDVDIEKTQGSESMILKFKSIEKSAYKGCQFCYALACATRHFTRPDFSSRSIHWGVGRVTVMFDCKPIRVTSLMLYASKEAGIGILPASFELFAKPDEPSPWPVFCLTNTAPVRLHSKNRRNIVNAWISACAASHKSCDPDVTLRKFSPPKDGRVAPRRILEITKKNPWNGIRLVDFSASTGPYLSVIHACTTPLEAPLSVTTSHNIKERQNRTIQWWQVPVAFQETILIAHEQNIRYIWIPDFCVMQDNSEDRNWHLDRQDMIFSRAYITAALAASGNKDLRLSNFGARAAIVPRNDDPDYYDKPMLFESATIQLRRKRDGRHYRVYARHSMHADHQLLQYGPKLESHKTETNLLARVFGKDSTFQGIVFSSRVLHVRGSEMVWECLEAMECECQGHQRRHPPPKSSSTTAQTTTTTAAAAAVTAAVTAAAAATFGAGPLYALDYWNMLDVLASGPPMIVLESYLRLPSANADEKLVNIGSLLRQISQLGPAPRRENFAGLLTTSAGELARELLWSLVLQVHHHDPDGSQHPHRPHMRSHRPRRLRTHRHHTPKIPTWSWASMVIRDAQKICTVDKLLGPYPGLREPFSQEDSFRLEECRFDPESGGRGDSFLASHWVLELSGKMASAVISAAPAAGIAVLREDGTTSQYMTYMPIRPVSSGPPERSYNGSQFRPDCHRWLRSVGALENAPLSSRRVELLLLGRSKAGSSSTDADAFPYPPEGADFESSWVDVGLVLRRSSRCYAENSFERLGTFFAPADYGFFEGCVSERFALV